MKQAAQEKDKIAGYENVDVPNNTRGHVPLRSPKPGA